MFAISKKIDGIEKLVILNNDNGKLKITDEKELNSKDASLHFMTISEDNVFYSRFSHGEKNKNHYKYDNKKIIECKFDNYILNKPKEHDIPDHIIGNYSLFDYEHIFDFTIMILSTADKLNIKDSTKIIIFNNNNESIIKIFKFDALMNGRHRFYLHENKLYLFFSG